MQCLKTHEQRSGEAYVIEERSEAIGSDFREKMVKNYCLPLYKHILMASIL